jgi:hypothetical protein
MTSTDQAPLDVEELKKRLQYLEALLPDVAQLIDSVKQDWGHQGCWSEWDQSVRDRIGDYNLYRMGQSELPESGTTRRLFPRVLTGEKAQQYIDVQARRLYEEAVAVSDTGASLWDQTGPWLRDRFRSKAMAKREFMCVHFENDPQQVIVAKSVTGSYLRILFGMHKDHQLTLLRAGEPDQVVSAETQVHALESLMRFRVMFPSNGG